MGWGDCAYICEHTRLQFIDLFETGKISFLEFSEIMEKGDNSLEKTTDEGEGDGDTKVEGEEVEMEIELDTDKKAEPVKPSKSIQNAPGLTLNASMATKVVCFSRLLKRLRCLYGKQCGPRSDCSYRSSLFWVHTVCFYT